MTVCKNLTDGEDFGLLSLQIAPYFYIGIFRLLSFLVLFIMFYYCKKYAQRTGNLGIARYFLVLPIYLDFLRFLIFYCAVIGGLNVLLRGFFVSPVALSAQLGGFHFFYEGLWFFLTQFGAGRKAFLWATGFGLLSGCVSFFTFLFATYYLENDDDDAAFVILMCYNVVYAAISLTPILIPIQHLYRRPAMLGYTCVQVGYYGLWIVCVVFVYFEQDVGYCLGAANYILFDGILKPMIIFYTLSIDSQVSSLYNIYLIFIYNTRCTVSLQYWQGVGVAETPLMGAWEIDMSTADTISKVDSRQGSGVPFIHFGLIELTKDMGFVAGGFSRVYFGQYKTQPIALKMLFVVDLTPESIKDFCKEAKLLIKLKNENVIECLGVSVMPPAVSIVLEFCRHGSLFDLLYKERSTKKNFYQHSLNAVLGPDNQHTARILSFGSTSENTNNPLNRKSFLSDARGSGVSSPDITRLSHASGDSSNLSESLVRVSGKGSSRKSFFGRESIFGSSKAVREDTKQLLYSHSQGKVGSEWDKLKKYLMENPTFVFSPIIEDEMSVQSELTMTDSILRWSNQVWRNVM